MMRLITDKELLLKIWNTYSSLDYFTTFLNECMQIKKEYLKEPHHGDMTYMYDFFVYRDVAESMLGISKSAISILEETISILEENR
jgi:hypothetical protein